MAASARTKLLKQAGGLLALGSLAMVLGAGFRRMTDVPEMIVEAKPIPVLGSARFLVPIGLRAQYFSKLTEFAAQHRLQIRISPSRLNADWFTTDMRRFDLIATGDNMVDAAVFRFKLLPMPGVTTVPGEPEKLMADLQRRVLAVPGIAIAPAK